MKNQPRTHRRALGLLLAAAALPFTPLGAQTAEGTEAPVVVDVGPPPVTNPEPAATAPSAEPAAETAPASETAPESETTSARTVATTARRTPARARTPAPTRTPTPAPAAVADVPVTPAPVVDATAEPSTIPPGVTAVPPPPVIAPPPIIDERSPFERAIPWLILGAIAIGALFYVLSRRRRRETLYDEASVEQNYEAAASAPVNEPVANSAGLVSAAAATPPVSTLVRNRRNATAEPLAPALEVSPAPQAGLVTSGLAASVGSAAVGRTADDGSRANLRIAICPMRAGINMQDAVVEFELMIENRGPGTARDVRISTWMFPAASAQEEAEQYLIVRPPVAVLEQIGAGDRQRIEASATLPISGIGQDSLLPAVATEARYEDADGSERRTSARFAVGVPLDGELAHFDVENPSGMHDNVEARPLNAERA